MRSLLLVPSISILLVLAGCSSSSSGVDAGVDGETPDGDGGPGDGPTGDQDPGEDHCLGVVCDDPPGNACSPDGREAWVYEAIGDCAPATGACAYDHASIKCETGCQNAQCAGHVACEGVDCYSPPSPQCSADGSTLTRFAISGTCDPVTERCGYASSTESCPNGCRFGRCQPPPGAEAAVQAGSDTRLCSFFWGGDARANHHEMGRLKVRPGCHPVDLQAPSELDWVEILELNPGGAAATARGPAQVTPTLAGTREEGWYLLDLSQLFDGPEGVYHLYGTLAFQVQGDRLVEPVLDLDAGRVSFVTDVFLRGQLQPDGLVPAYAPCDRSSYEVHPTITLQGGDTIELIYAFTLLGCPGGMGCAGEPFPGQITWAQFTKGAAVRTVTDFFDQAFTTYHHSDGPSFYLVLDEPADGVYAVWIPRDPVENTPTQVQYLDAGGQVIETRAILSITGME